MKLSLSENIRRLRKRRRLTQEKLAEALGVTAGAVYKWESGQSQPELDLVVELADFFDTSVDALLGRPVRDNSLESALDRIFACCRTMDPAALTEADKTLGRYPHSFRAVFGCATVYLAFGTDGRDPARLRRALELLERARLLLNQNDDPAVNEATFAGNMAIARFLLGEKEKSLELLKRYNANGVFSSQIGALLSVCMDEPEEAAPFLSEALLDGVSTLLTAVLGFVFLFRSRNDWSSALDILTWSVGLLDGVRTLSHPDALDKSRAELLVLLSCARAKNGMRAEAADTLRKARSLAMRFDSMPDYSLKTMRFGDHMDQSLILDVFGVTAAESIDALIRYLNDPELAAAWKETENDEP